MSDSRKRPTTVYMDPSDLARLEAIAERERRPVAWVMRELIRRALPSAEQAERL